MLPGQGCCLKHGVETPYCREYRVQCTETHLLIHIEFLSLDKVSQLHMHGAYVEINQGFFVHCFARLTLRVLTTDSIASLKNEEAKHKQNMKKKMG